MLEHSIVNFCFEMTFQWKSTLLQNKQKVKININHFDLTETIFEKCLSPETFKIILVFLFATTLQNKFRNYYFPGNKNSISFSDLVKPSKLVGFHLCSAGHRGLLDPFRTVCVRKLIKTGP